MANIRSEAAVRGAPLPPAPSDVEREILAAVAGIRYGSVVVSIQDGRVVQIDATEKRRIAAAS
jgi:hypothetical protein